MSQIKSNEYTRTVGVELNDRKISGSIPLDQTQTLATELQTGNFAIKERFTDDAIRSINTEGDIFLLREHDFGHMLTGTRSKEMRVWRDGNNLRFEAELPETSVANDTLALMKKGVLNAVSFRMQLQRKLEIERDGTRVFNIQKVNNFSEISIVARPAYENTEVAALRAEADSVAKAIGEVKEQITRGRRNPFL